MLLAVQARTALGQTSCLGISATVSGNQSHRAAAPVCSLGIAPADWKLQMTLGTTSWSSAGMTPPSFRSNVTVLDVESPYSYTRKQDVSNNPTSLLIRAGTRVADVLPGTGLPGDVGIWEFLAFPNKYEGLPNAELIRHLLAARLNAGAHSDYPIKQSQIREIWEAVRTGGRYCPSSIACTGSMGMSALDVVEYIKSTYAVAESPMRYTCKKA